MSDRSDIATMFGLLSPVVTVCLLGDGFLYLATHHAGGGEVARAPLRPGEEPRWGDSEVIDLDTFGVDSMVMVDGALLMSAESWPRGTAVLRVAFDPEPSVEEVVPREPYYHWYGELIPLRGSLVARLRLQHLEVVDIARGTIGPELVWSFGPLGIAPADGQTAIVLVVATGSLSLVDVLSAEVLQEVFVERLGDGIVELPPP